MKEPSYSQPTIALIRRMALSGKSSRPGYERAGLYDKLAQDGWLVSLGEGRYIASEKAKRYVMQ